MATYRPEARHWLFTLNNPTLDELQLTLIFEHIGYDYLVFQMEEAPTTGTPHYQGYVVFSRKRRLSTFNGLIPAHFIIARGSPEQNREYCTKEPRIGEFCELGKIPDDAGQGKRSDLVELHFALRNGLSNVDFSNDHFAHFLKYPNLVSNYNVAQIVPRTNGCTIQCVLILGPPGTGKSRYAATLADSWALGPTYRHSTRQWWDGYRGERVVIFDDFRGSCLSFTDFKRVVDRYALRVQIKGSSCDLAATHFIFTTNSEPTTWWQEEVTAGDAQAIYRRIDKVLYMPTLNTIHEFPEYADYARVVLQRIVAHGPPPLLPPPLVIEYDEE